VDPVLLITIGVVLAILALYLLFLRRAVMLGFLCIIGVVVVAVLYYAPDRVGQ
jgi:hypothetical protein